MRIKLYNQKSSNHRYCDDAGDFDDGAGDDDDIGDDDL
jgi:hypothetical protein